MERDERLSGCHSVENENIAQALNHAICIVANRLRTTCQNLRVTNRTQAAHYALRQDWAALDEPPEQATPG